MVDVSKELSGAHRDYWGQIVASVLHLCKDICLAEDCTQEAFSAATISWKKSLPDNQKAWLKRVARNKAVDEIRRREILQQKSELLSATLVVNGGHTASTDLSDPKPGQDELFGLLLACASPSLSREAQIVLMLRMVCGLDVPEIARLLLVKPATVAARLTRAKKARGVELVCSGAMQASTDAGEEVILECIFLLGTSAIDRNNTEHGDEALYLAELLVRSSPSLLEAHGLLSLLQFDRARQGKGYGPGAVKLLLPESDRSAWDVAMITDALKHSTISLNAELPGAYALLSGISALHTVAPTAEDADWTRIIELYDALGMIWDTPIVAMNRIMARSHLTATNVALGELELLVRENPVLESYPYFYAAKASLAARMGNDEAAELFYEQAAELTPNADDAELLRRHRDEVRRRFGSDAAS